MSTGIICEYNPFHNGHKYHIEKIKEKYKDDTIILVMSSHFLQRGESSIMDKWKKTEVALLEGVDLVIELPFVFSSQGADIFAKGAIEILDSLNVDRIVFGSETNDIEILKDMASVQIGNSKFNKLVKDYIDEGVNYPTAVSKAIKILTKCETNSPNDLLGICYIKEIMKQKSKIKPECILRTNDFHSKDAYGTIASATSIRTMIKDHKNYSKFVPESTLKYLEEELYFIDDYFDLLKYKIITNLASLDKFQTVDEGIEARIKKYIFESNDLESLINNIKTKRYTYNKIKRMLVHILCDFTKEDANNCKESEYIRVLGFNEKGKNYLNKVKKESRLPIITGYSNIESKILDIEFKVSSIYFMISKEKNKNDLINMEYKHKPVIK
jgi:predicted nucleotidyltransferase